VSPEVKGANMPVIRRTVGDNLFEDKWRCLEELAALEVDLCLPPTDRLVQDRKMAVLSRLREIDAECEAVGIDADYGVITWMAEGHFEVADAKDPWW
jgi:hypothetical protein